VLLPWSVLSDDIEKGKVLLLFEQFSDIVKKGGHIILDIPLPIGKHSYEEMIAEQVKMERVLGIMRRSFKLSADQEIESIFSFPPLEETLVMAGNKGFVPMYNIPNTASERTKMYKEIQENDAQLTLNHISTLYADGTVKQSDHNAMKHGLWQATSGDQKFNRVTLILRKDDSENAEKSNNVSQSIPCIAQQYRN
jgi:hypothetical protein